MNHKHSKCLILNSDYTPLGIINWKRAMIWSIKHKNSDRGIEIIDFYKNDFILGTNNKKYPIPSIAKTINYFRTKEDNVKFSRKNLFIRDNYSCQYCGSKPGVLNLTYDHVIPKSKWKSINGSPTCWTNIVTACQPCNRRKGNRTPKEANFKLKNLPIIPKKHPKYLPIAHHLVKIRSDIPPEWFIYLPESYHL